MYNEDAKLEALIEEFRAVANALKEVLEDLEWRKPDVEAEEGKLAQLIEQAKTDPLVDVASQAIVVRVLREVLDDKLAEAEALEQKMLILRDQIDALQKERSKPEKVRKRGQAVR